MDLCCGNPDDNMYEAFLDSIVTPQRTANYDVQRTSQEEVTYFGKVWAVARSVVNPFYDARRGYGCGHGDKDRIHHTSSDIYFQ